MNGFLFTLLLGLFLGTMIHFSFAVTENMLNQSLDNEHTYYIPEDILPVCRITEEKH